jgi:hypothetical protein
VEGRPAAMGERSVGGGGPVLSTSPFSETCQDEGETVKRRIWKQERRAEYGS